MKMTKILCILMAALMLIGLLTACGGTANTNDAPKDADADAEATEAVEEAAEAPLHCGWYYAIIPDGFTATDEAEDEFETADGNKTIKCYFSRTFSDKPDAAAAAEDSAGFSDFYTLGEPVTIGNFTWHTVEFTWDDDAPCREFYADIYDGFYAEITMFGMTQDDPEAKTFLESFKLKEGDPDENQQAFYQEIYG